MRRAAGRGHERDPSGLPTVAQLGPLSRAVKGTLPGNLAGALWRSRRMPASIARAALAARGERGSVAPAHPPRTRFRAVYVVLAGPGDWPALHDLLDSIRRFEEDAKVVVVDDASADCRQSVVRAAFPGVDVVRRRWPSSGPPRNFRPLAQGIAAALRYDFEVLGKLDTDALVTGPAPSAAAGELFAREPRIGMAGTYGMRGDGVPESYDFDAFVLATTRRWSPSAARLMRRAEVGGYDGAKVHGGVYFVSRAALDALARSGHLGWRPPWWTQLAEDFWLSVMMLANGFELGSLGGPGEPLLVASKHLPLPKEQVLAEGKLAVHSVRRGRDGEDERELRAFFRQARTRPREDSASSGASRPPVR